MGESTCSAKFFAAPVGFTDKDGRPGNASLHMEVRTAYSSES